MSHPLLLVRLPTLRIFRGLEVGRTVPVVILAETKAGHGGSGVGAGNWCLLFQLSGLGGPMAGGCVLFGYGAGFPGPSRPGRPILSTRSLRMGSRSGLCVKRRWGGEVQRPAPRPGSLPAPPSASPSLLSLSAAATRAGRARGRLRHTLTHTHTHPRSRTRSLHLVLLPWRTHRGSRVSRCQRTGQRLPNPPQHQPFANSCFFFR